MAIKKFFIMTLVIGSCVLLTSCHSSCGGLIYLHDGTTILECDIAGLLPHY